MDAFNRMTGRSPMAFSPSTILKMTDLDPRVQGHLSRVYATLAAALCCLSLGVVADGLLALGGTLTTLAAFGCLLWLAATPAAPGQQAKRYALLGAFAFLQGCGLGPLFSLAMAVSPSVILTAAMSTVTVFASFSLSAVFTRRRSFLFLGGYLSSAVLGMMTLRLGSWLLGAGRLAFEAELYLGLLVFAGYVLFDTQLIVERAAAGDFDNVRHALDLFCDFVAILVRVTVILLRNAEKRQQEEGRRRKRA